MRGRTVCMPAEYFVRLKMRPSELRRFVANNCALCAGTRIVTSSDTKTVAGIQFDAYGTLNRQSDSRNASASACRYPVCRALAQAAGAWELSHSLAVRTGAHIDNYPCVYMTAACAIGIRRHFRRHARAPYHLPLQLTAVATHTANPRTRRPG